MSEKIKLSRVVEPEVLNSFGICDPEESEEAEIFINPEKRSIYFKGCEGINKYACIYKGILSYLSQEERIMILRSSHGEDFNVVPEDFYGKLIKMEIFFRKIFPFELGMTIIRELDGELSAVTTFNSDCGYIRVKYNNNLYHDIAVDKFASLKDKVFSEAKDPIMSNHQ